VADALVEPRNAAGTQFDPEMVDAIEQALDEAEREGRPWTGDGTISQSARGAWAAAAAGMAARAANGASNGAPTSSPAPDGNGSRTRPPAPRDGSGASSRRRSAATYGGAEYDRNSYKRDEYDHDDPAFAVPSPASDEQARPAMQNGIRHPRRFARRERR
jgi:hypothetical protein